MVEDFCKSWLTPICSSISSSVILVCTETVCIHKWSSACEICGFCAPDMA